MQLQTGKAAFRAARVVLAHGDLQAIERDDPADGLVSVLAAEPLEPVEADVLDAVDRHHRLENVGDVMRDRVLSELFAGSKDPIAVIKWKDIYQDAETVLDVCEDVAHVVDSIMVKQA